MAAGGSAEEAERAAMSAISARDKASLNTLQTEQPEAYAELARTAALFPSAMQDSELGEIPVGWEVSKLSNIASFANSRTDVSTLSLKNYISTENMLEGKVGITEASSLPSVKTVPLFKENQVLVSNIRPYFMKIWLASFEGGRSNDVLGFESKDNECSKFLYNLLYQDSFFNYMMQTSKGAKMPRGYKVAIMNWRFACPAIDIRKKYSNSVSYFYRTINSNNEENKSLQQARDILLPKLLSGELTPPDNALTKANPPESDMLNAGSVPAEVMV